MRKLALLGLYSSLVLSACKWTEFDDLSNEAPAHSTTKPDVKSSDWGVAVASAQSAGDGANVLVIGTDPPTFSTIVHDTDGNTHLGQNAIDLNIEFAISSIPDPPILLDDPTSDSVALVVPTLDGRILVEGGPANMPTQLGVIGADPQPLAATYIGMTTKASPIFVVGKGSTTSSTTSGNLHNLDVATNTQASCTINDENVSVTALTPVAMASAPAVNAPNGLVVVWKADGKLIAYDQAALLDPTTGCIGNQNTMLPITPPGWAANAIDTGFVPVEGQIAIVGDHYALLEGHGDPAKGDKGTVLVFDLTTGTAVGTPLEADGVRGFAVGALGDKTYLALGFPSNEAQPSDGGASVTAGTVEVREVDPTTGLLGATIALQLSDAQPESNEKFGRAVAITNFGGMPILVVAASNEIFSYYKTSIYDIGLK